MKLVRIVSLFVCSLMLLLALASCGGAAKPSIGDLYEGTYAPQSRVLKQAERVTLSEVKESDDGFLLTAEGKQYQVYDMVEMKTVLELTQDTNVKLSFAAFEVGNGRCFAVYQTKTGKNGTTYQTSLYDAAGQLLGSSASSAERVEPEPVLDLLGFDGKLYRAKDGAVVQAGELSALAGKQLSRLTDTMNGRYYRFDTASFSVYDSSCAYYDLVVYESADSTEAHLLANGNVLIQYTFNLPDDAKKYDYFENSRKKSVKTYLWRADKKSVSEIDLDYVVNTVIPITEEDRKEEKETTGIVTSRKIDNLAMVSPIQNGRLQAARMIVLQNNGSVKYDLSKMFKGIVAAPFPVAKDVFSYITRDGQSFCVDKKGKLLGNISGAEATNEKFLLADGKVYDRSFTLLFSYEAEGYTLEQLYSDCIIFRKKGEYIRYDGSSKTKLDIQSADTVDFDDAYYAVSTVKGKTTYFAPDGTQRFQADTELMPVCMYEDRLLFSFIEKGKKVYVMFTLG